MIGSRAGVLLSAISRNSKLKTSFLQQVRNDSHGHGDPHGGWTYRAVKEPERWQVIGATGCASFVWWWIYWNLWHGYGHVLGWYDGKPLRNPRSYTDEELGIPPE